MKFKFTRSLLVLAIAALVISSPASASKKLGDDTLVIGQPGSASNKTIVENVGGKAFLRYNEGTGHAEYSDDGATYKAFSGGSVLNKVRFTCGQGVADANTNLLLTCESTSATTPLYDYSPNGLTPSGSTNSPLQTTLHSKFGVGSCGPGGTNNGYYTYAGNPAFALGSGDFAVDFWWYTTDNTCSGADCGFFSLGNNTNAGDYALYTQGSNGFLHWYDQAGCNVTSTSAPSNGALSHIAVVRSSGTITFYINGTASGSGACATNYNNTSDNFQFMSDLAHATPNRFYIDEFRISNVARWTTNFTPPTSAYAVTNSISVDPNATISSVTGGASPGSCTVNFNGGIYSSEPVCTCNIISATLGESGCQFTGNNTTSAATLQTRVNGAAANSSVYMICE